MNFDIVIESIAGLFRSIVKHKGNNAHLTFDMNDAEDAFYWGQLLGSAKILIDCMEDDSFEKSSLYKEHEEMITQLISMYNKGKKIKG